MSDHDQIAEAYERMARWARYRPAAPSDGLGNITVPVAELDLQREIDQYARWWHGAERTGIVGIRGCCNYSTRPATIFTIEAARSLCGGANDVAIDLLRMALSDLENLEPKGAA